MCFRALERVPVSWKGFTGGDKIICFAGFQTFCTVRNLYMEDVKSFCQTAERPYRKQRGRSVTGTAYGSRSNGRRKTDIGRNRRMADAEQRHVQNGNSPSDERTGEPFRRSLSRTAEWGQLLIQGKTVNIPQWGEMEKGGSRQRWFFLRQNSHKMLKMKEIQ